MVASRGPPGSACFLQDVESSPNPRSEEDDMGIFDIMEDSGKDPGENAADGEHPDEIYPGQVLRLPGA